MLFLHRMPPNGSDVAMPLDVIFYLKELGSGSTAVGHWQVVMPHCDVFAAVDADACQTAGFLYGYLLPHTYGQRLHAGESVWACLVCLPYCGVDLAWMSP